MHIRINWRSTIAAAFITATLLAFPFVNPCQAEDGTACTWNASESGNGSGTSFTDFYGLTFYLP